MLGFATKLTPLSALRYAHWRVARPESPINLALRSGPRFELRSGSGSADYGVAYEIFVLGYYDGRAGPAPESIGLILDLGVNVGFSLLYFLHRYPRCAIIGFEPHPAHFAQAERNLTLDGNRSRVQLHRAAAGASSRSMWLRDMGASSSLADRDCAGAIAVEVVDIFPLLAGKRIDLIKMDIEGAEYEILGDQRFGDLDVAAMVMEWHAPRDGSDGRKWCVSRLHGLGYAIEEIWTQRKVGMLWARR
ncbi:MAG: FkbM family methyltransferase [Acetobacteraceae bacterium]